MSAGTKTTDADGHEWRGRVCLTCLRARAAHMTSEDVWHAMATATTVRAELMAELERRAAAGGAA